MNVRNARFDNRQENSITGDIQHPLYGWIPYTAIRGISQEMDEIFDAFIASQPLPYMETPQYLDGLRWHALDKLPQWEESERTAGIEHAGQRWLTTPLALQDIRDVLLAGAVPNEQWATADRQIVPMTLPELQSLWQAITARGAQIYQRRLEMEQQIAGMSREQLEAFVPGWPEGSM